MTSSAKTKSRFLRRIVAGIAGIALVSSGIIISAHADPPAGSVYDLDKEIKNAPELKVFDKKIETTGVKATAGSAVATSDSVETTDAGMVSQNSSVLVNDLDTEQIVSSAPISVTEANSITTSATQGLTLGFEQELTAKAEFFGTGAESKTTFSASFNASWTQSKTVTTTRTYTLPQQPVRIPPHSKVRVESYLQKVNIKGVLRPVITLEGNVVLEKTCGGKVSVPIGELMGMLHDNGRPLHPAAMTTDGPVARFTGEIPFSGVVGTALRVRFFDDGQTSNNVDAGTAKSGENPSSSAAGLLSEVVSPPLPSDDVSQLPTTAGSAKEKPTEYLNSLDARAQCPGGQNSPVDERVSGGGGYQKGEFLVSGKKVDTMLPYVISISNLKYFWGAEWSYDSNQKVINATITLTGNGETKNQKIDISTSHVNVTPDLYGVFGGLAEGTYRLSAEITVDGGYWGSRITSSQIGVDVTI